MTKKQRKSSRKNMANRAILKYFKRMENAHIANVNVAAPVISKPKSSGYAASIKRASGRGE